MRKISIITPVYNGMPYLKYCIESVQYAFKELEHDWQYEHIIMDGGSTDGTLDFLKSQNKILWFSEKDKGMYDALNKGISKANGSWIGHLNSDEQYNPKGLASALRLAVEPTSLVMGPTVMVNKNHRLIQFFKQIIKPSIEDTYWCMPVQSCSLIYQKKCWEKYNYDTRFKLVADHDWFRKQMELGATIEVIKEPFGIFVWRPDNLSNQSRNNETLQEDALADIDRNTFRLKWVKHKYRFKKWIYGGYKREPISYEIFTENGKELVRELSPQLKVKHSDLEL